MGKRDWPDLALFGIGQIGSANRAWLDTQSGKIPQSVIRIAQQVACVPRLVQKRPYLDKFEAPEALDRCIRILGSRRIFLAIVQNRLILTGCTTNTALFN